jgi:hypothetical protein
VSVFCAGLKQPEEKWHFWGVCGDEFDEDATCNSNVTTATGTKKKYIATALMTMNN